MSGYMTYIDHTKDAGVKKKSESPKSLPNRSDFLRHKRRVPDRTGISMEDMRIHYRSNQTVIQMYPIHPSFMVESYDGASRSTELAEHALALMAAGESRNSVILRTSLVEDNGVPDSRIVGSDPEIDYAIENQAHHIVETHNFIGQDFLVNAGITSNSAANGVLLPEAERDETSNATNHKGSHSGEYTACVNEALRIATNGLTPHTDWYKESVIAVLVRIRWILLNSNMALNSRGDADYKDGSPNGKKVFVIFFRSKD